MHITPTHQPSEEGRDAATCRQALQRVLEIIEQSGAHPNFEKLYDKYEIKDYNVDRLKPGDISGFFEHILHKNALKKSKRSWCENELRLFVWLIFHYAQVKTVDIDSFNSEDWSLIATVFTNKDAEDCKFEWLSLSKAPNNPASWTLQQERLLQSIIQRQNFQNNWNQIAKELYKQSCEKYFRKPKQCRERWRNYLDPNLKKSGWTLQQDKALFEMVLEIGKKWSAIAKQLKTKTEHSVKNRFKSQIKKYNKRHCIKPKPKKFKSTPAQLETARLILQELLEGGSQSQYNQKEEEGSDSEQSQVKQENKQQSEEENCQIKHVQIQKSIKKQTRSYKNPVPKIENTSSSTNCLSSQSTVTTSNNPKKSPPLENQMMGNSSTNVKMMASPPTYPLGTANTTAVLNNPNTNPSYNAPTTPTYVIGFSSMCWNTSLFINPMPQATNNNGVTPVNSNNTNTILTPRPGIIAPIHDVDRFYPISPNSAFKFCGRRIDQPIVVNSPNSVHQVNWSADLDYDFL